MPTGMMIVAGVAALILAFLVVGEVAWIFRGREFQALCRQIADQNAKLADAELRLNVQQDKTIETESRLSAANARLDRLAKIEQELDSERKTAGELNDEVLRLRAEARAGADVRESQTSSLLSLSSEIAQKLGAIADEVLKASAKDFLDLAGNSFEAQARKFSAVADDVLKANTKDFLDVVGHLIEAQRRAAGAQIADLLMPIGAWLAKYEPALAALENTRSERQERWAEIATIGKNLHPEIRAMVDHVHALGSSLDRSIRQFNELVGGLEGRVIPQVQRLNELTIQGTSELRVREFSEIFNGLDGSAKAQMLSELAPERAIERIAALQRVDSTVKFPEPHDDILDRAVQMHPGTFNGEEEVRVKH